MVAVCWIRTERFLAYEASEMATSLTRYCLAAPNGIEPLHAGIKIRCLTVLAKGLKFGAGDRIRTDDRNVGNVSFYH